MTNDKTVTMSRELADLLLRSLHQRLTIAETEAGIRELCALLAAPVVERQPVEPRVVGYMPDSPDGDPLITLESHQDYVAELQASVERLTERCIEKDALISEMDRIGSSAMARPCTSPPAPVAVVRDPFAWYTEEYLTDKSATTYDMATAERWKAKGWPVQPLYISPELDAANAFAKGFNTLETGDGKYKIVMQFAGRDNAWAAYNALAKMTACADKVKELNQ